MIFPVIVLLFVCIAMPLGYAWRIWRLEAPSLAAWLAVVAEGCLFVALVFIVGRWDIAGYYTRLPILGILLAAILLSGRRHASRPFHLTGTSLWRGNRTTVFSIALFGAALAWIGYGLLPPTAARDLAFPLTEGRYVIAQGGGNMLLNRHADHPEQRYAIDVTRIGGSGFRANGVLPGDLRDYAIFSAKVVSPCKGEVTATRDGLPDLEPPKRDAENPAGNHVRIACDGLSVELAHLRKGTVAVQPGDKVNTGDVIGRVGNSGNTSEPHLHFHAVDAEHGTGVPVSFNGRVPVRNRAYDR